MSEVDYDTRRGHCYVRGDNGRTIASLTDMGGACAVTADGDMTPEEATLLGHALISWSAWRRRIIPVIDHYQQTATTRTRGTDDNESTTTEERAHG